MAAITILDTTLRDGALTEDVNLSVADKLRLAPLIDSLGVTYIEGGWPQVTPSDIDFLRQAADLNLKARLVAFGPTRRPETRPERDSGMRALLDAGTPTVQLYGKVWPLHVEKVLRTNLDENIVMLRESIEYMRGHGKEVLVIAEHFFDGYRDNPEYAMRFVRTALECGADILTLGDSNGGTLPGGITEGVSRTLELAEGTPVGFHVHNDCGLALANAIAAIEAGATHAQGSVNGYGARNGITDLTALIPLMKLRMGLEVVTDEQLERITPVARTIAEFVGLGAQMRDRPFVGQKVFAHKTETHIAAVLSNPEAYEPIPPQKVGNQRRMVIPSVQRPAYLARIAEAYGVDLRVQSAANSAILAELKRLEDEGYSFEDAPASLELSLGLLSGHFQPVLHVERVRLFETIRERERPVVEAALRVRIGDETEYVAAEADAPGEALLSVIRSALDLARDRTLGEYARRIRIESFRARTLHQHPNPMRIRASLSFTDGQREWTTIGISHDFIQAAWKALIDGVEYGLVTRDQQRAQAAD